MSRRFVSGFQPLIRSRRGVAWASIALAIGAGTDTAWPLVGLSTPVGWTADTLQVAAAADMTAAEKKKTAKTAAAKAAAAKSAAAAKAANEKTAGAKTAGAKTPAAKTPAVPVPLSRLPAALELPPPPAATDGKSGEAKRAAVKSADGKSDDGKSESLVVGKLDLPSQADCVVYLRGGETAAGGREPRAKFHLVEQPAASDTAGGVGHWLVFSGRAAEDGPTKPAIAELRRESDQLTFRWLEQAASEPSSRQLANCVLEISAAQSRRFLPLRRTVKGDPLTFQFQDAMQTRWELPDAPEPWRVKVELRLASKEPRYRFVGNSTLDASQGQTWIEFMDRRSTEALKLKIECELRGDQLKLQAVAFFQAPGEPNPVRLSPAMYKRSVERVKAVVTQLEGQLAALAAAGKSAGARDGGKGGKGNGGRGKGGESPAELARKQWEKQLATAREAAKQLDDLAELQRLVDGHGQLLVRAVMEVEGQSVVLLQADKPQPRVTAPKSSR